MVTLFAAYAQYLLRWTYEEADRAIEEVRGRDLLFLSNRPPQSTIQPLWPPFFLYNLRCFDHPWGNATRCLIKKTALIADNGTNERTTMPLLLCNGTGGGGFYWPNNFGATSTCSSAIRTGMFVVGIVCVIGSRVGSRRQQQQLIQNSISFLLACYVLYMFAPLLSRAHTTAPFFAKTTTTSSSFSGSF